MVKLSVGAQRNATGAGEDKRKDIEALRETICTLAVPADAFGVSSTGWRRVVTESVVPRQRVGEASHSARTVCRPDKVCITGGWRCTCLPLTPSGL